MALLEIGGAPFDADLVIFDKDGTLVDFEFMWGQLAVAQVEELVSWARGDEALRTALYESVGYDWQNRRTLPQSPWALASTEQVLTILAATLYRHGFPWSEAEAEVRSAWRRVCAPAALAGLVRPTADLGGLFAALREARVRIAVVTTDEREVTEETLRLLRIDGLVDFLACGGDGLPVKPAPDMMLAACRELGVAPERTVVVGDTVFDLLMGERAGAGLLVGVLSGADTLERLAPHADVVLRSVDEIGIE